MVDAHFSLTPLRRPATAAVDAALRRLLVLALALPTLAQAFGFDDVARRASTLASAAYKAPVSQLAPELRALDYDAYRDIRFRPEQALWRAEKLPFELMFFPTGRGFQDPVRLSTIEPEGVKRLDFDPAMFDFGRNKFDDRKLRTIDWAGFRVHHAVNNPGYKDEIVVFLGASYFRAVGQSQVYGLSARGLAVDTAAPAGEEFPRFLEFWIERPKRGATSLTIYALLDSVRVAGAYKFVVAPGKETAMHVTSRIYARDAGAKFGFAPLNSMFQFGENQPGRDDYRPEVHDSDGLSILTGGGEWLWRPLVNPKRLLVTSFAATDPRGFGLMQRDRAPASYEDPEALYERRPSLWVEPIGAWGSGRVELVQIPTPDETNDNIVAYWVPDKPLAPKQPIDVNYRLRWQLSGTVPAGKGWVVQTRRGRGYTRQADGDIQYVVDFDGPALRALGSDARLDAVIEVGPNAELRETNLFRNQSSGAWRMTVRFKRADAAKPVELRAYLKPGESPVSASAAASSVASTRTPLASTASALAALPAPAPAHAPAPASLAKQTSRAALTETWSYILPSESEKP